MSVLVTGGAGFVGSHVVDALIRNGETVVIVDNLSSGKVENINQSAIFEEMDFTSHHFKDLVAAYRPRIIYHIGAVPRVTYSVEYPVESNFNNINGTLNVLEAARWAEVERVVYSASSSAFGGATVLPTPEDAPKNPRSPYAVQKYVGELYCSVYSSVYNLDTVGLRYFNVFGPRQDKNSPYTGVIAVFAQQLLSNNLLTIDGDGTQSRDFTYIENVVQANLRAGNLPKTIGGQVFNVGCSEPVSVLAIAEKMTRLLRPDLQSPPIEFRAPRIGDVKHSHADITAICNQLGYQPSILFDEGLKITCDWYRQQFETESAV